MCSSVLGQSVAFLYPFETFLWYVKGERNASKRNSQFTLVFLELTFYETRMPLSVIMTHESHRKSVTTSAFSYCITNVAKLMSRAHSRFYCFKDWLLKSSHLLILWVPKRTFKKLRPIQNAAAWELKGTKTSDHITPMFMSPHWRPVSYRIEYKEMIIKHNHIMCCFKPHTH